MLSLEGFPPPVRPPCAAVPHNAAVSQFSPLPTKTRQTHLSFCSNRRTQLGFCAVLGQSRTGFSAVPGQSRTGFCVSASKSRRKGGNGDTLLEMDGVDAGFEDGDFDFDDDDGGSDFEFDDENEIDGGDGEDDDGEVFVPLRSMKKWAKNKPSGFGEGKVYDTSVEQKLLEEIEKSKEAQIANINQLKNIPENRNSSKEVDQKQKAIEVVPTGFRVRLLNLPKKKNIHRDLQLAFKGVPGIVNIKPVVLGNKKTRDPICKGTAFVDFKSEDEAYRFVQIFSTQDISFGKIQKQIKCEIVNPNSPNSAAALTARRTYNPPLQVLPSFEDDPDPDSGIDDPSLDSAGENVNYEVAEEDIGEDLVTVPLSDPSGNLSMEPRTESSTESLSPEHQEKTQATPKKPRTKRKEEKVPKLNIPGSANRLKIKEKGVLTEVFSKYGGLKAASVVKEKS